MHEKNLQSPESVATIDIMKTSGADWVLANLNVVGYYRVNYDQANWNRLLNVLSDNHLVRNYFLVHVTIFFATFGVHFLMLDAFVMFNNAFLNLALLKCQHLI